MFLLLCINLQVFIINYSLFFFLDLFIFFDNLVPTPLFYPQSADYSNYYEHSQINQTVYFDNSGQGYIMSPYAAYDPYLMYDPYSLYYPPTAPQGAAYSVPPSNSKRREDRVLDSSLAQ